MSPITKEATFPPSYRQAEVGAILGAVYRLRSIAVTGLAGMGKSNVMRFIASNAGARELHLRERAANTAFIHVDGAALPAVAEADVLAEILAQLARDGLVPGSPLAPDTNFRHVLQDRLLALDPALTLVVMLDDFDEAAAHLGRPFYNYLCHLRNSRPRANLCYVIATRRPLGPLFELQELLDDGCLVGPLSAADALDSLDRDEARLGVSFDAAERQALLAATGRHPGLLKNAAELLAGGRLSLEHPDHDVAGLMLASRKIESLCAELWGDLTPDEQAAAGHLAHDSASCLSPSDESLDSLERYGVVAGRPRALFCPVFGAYVAARTEQPGAVRLAAVFPNQARIETAAGCEHVTLPPRVFRLLQALAGGQGQVVPTDALIDQVYGAEAPGVSDAALSQLAKRLRGLLDPAARRLAGDPQYSTVETIRDVGYRLRV